MKLGSSGQQPLPPGYPSNLERDVVLLDGRAVHLRPILPSDAAQLRAAIQRADAETLRRRFLGGRPPYRDNEIARLTQVDYTTRMAVVALDAAGTGVGVARYDRGQTTETAEVAVAVDGDWRHVSLATCLLRVLAEHAATVGIRRFHAEFFSDNIDVLELLEESGLPVQQDRSEAGVQSADVTLSRSPWRRG
jgi:GNAT superfamily N-acetyltransferase